MGHVGSKSRSPGQILGNSCLHSIEATFVTQIELDLCFDIIYQHTKFELNRCSLSKVIEQTPNFDNGRTHGRMNARMDRGNT